MSRELIASFPGSNRSGSRLVIGIGLLVGGFILILNPLYIDALLPYPTQGDGFDLTPLYFSELLVIGFLFLSVGGYALVSDEPLTARRATGLVVVSTVLVILYSQIGLQFVPQESRVGPLDGWALLFIIGMLFPLGVAVKQSTLHEMRTVIVSIIAGSFALIILEILRSLAVGSSVYRAAARVGQGLFFWTIFLVLGRDLLGIPFIGVILALVPLVLGYLYPTSGAEDRG